MAQIIMRLRIEAVDNEKILHFCVQMYNFVLFCIVFLLVKMTIENNGESESE